MVEEKKIPKHLSSLLDPMGKEGNARHFRPARQAGSRVSKEAKARAPAAQEKDAAFPFLHTQTDLLTSHPPFK